MKAKHTISIARIHSCQRETKNNIWFRYERSAEMNEPSYLILVSTVIIMGVCVFVCVNKCLCVGLVIVSWNAAKE